MIKSFVDAIKNCFNVKGRTRMSAYWWYMLDVAIIEAAFGGLTAATGGLLGFLFGVVSVFAGIISITLTIRRLHDIGRSGWFLLWLLFPVVGEIVVFIATLRRGDSGPNKYGPNPKELHKLTTTEEDIAADPAAPVNE